jgi:hypothetical protein
MSLLPVGINQWQMGDDSELVISVNHLHLIQVKIYSKT